MTGRFVACGQPVGNLLVPSREILPKDLTDRLRAYVGRFYPSAVMLIEPDPFSRSRLDPVPRVTPFLASCGQALGPEARVQR
jgi:hypothetical protein